MPHNMRHARPLPVTDRELIVRQDQAFCAAMRAALSMGLEHAPIPAIPEGEWMPVRAQVLTEVRSLTSSSAGWVVGES